MSVVFITFANDNSKPKDQQSELMKHFTLLILLAATMAGAARADNGLKPRLVVCTDIAPADVEPDDMESMVRLMAYADCFEIEALITSVGWNCDPYPTEWAEYLQRVIKAYRKDVNNLMKRSAQQGFLPMDMFHPVMSSLCSFSSRIRSCPQYGLGFNGNDSTIVSCGFS